MKKVLCAFLMLAVVLGISSSAWGQSQITAGTVQGDVLDEKGGSVAGASVEAKNLDTNFTQTDTTNTDGHFAFLSLAPGRYVGVASPEVDQDFDFEQTLGDIHVELADLNQEAAVLAKTIQKNFEELGI